MELTTYNQTAPAMAGGSMAMAESNRKAAEVQAAMAVAKRFPRDQNIAYRNIIESCKRKTLAEKATYAYPRGGGLVIGPSIRLAEVLAQNWGNMDFGLIELDRTDGESSVMAYCWDLETNVKRTIVFQVRHVRDTKQGSKKLTDERDIYELVANMGARRMRACILNVIPGDIVEEALAQCNKTLSSGVEPIRDRARKMCNAFHLIGVDVPMIEAYLGHKLENIIEDELNNLRSIYTSIKDGHAKREDYFTLTSRKPEQTASDDDDNVTFDDQPEEKPKPKKKAKAKTPTMEHADLVSKFVEVINGHEEAVEAHCIESGWIEAGAGWENLQDKHLRAVLSQPEAFLSSIK